MSDDDDDGAPTEAFPRVVPEQGRLSRAGDGDAEFVLAAETERRLRQALQKPFDRFIVDDVALEPRRAVDLFGIAADDELQRADAVAADSGL